MGDTKPMNNTFAQLGLNEHILAGVEALGFTTPTPVQEQAIPLILEGRDVVASAQTGTGKTCAFVLPTLQRIASASRAAREQIAAEAIEAAKQVQDDATSSDGSEPITLADEVPPAASLSVPTSGEGSPSNDDDKPKAPRRRIRRRHHRRSTQVADANAANDVAVSATTSAEGATSEAVEGRTTSEAAGGSVATSATEDKPVTKRRRRRRGKRRKATNRDSSDASQLLDDSQHTGNAGASDESSANPQASGKGSGEDASSDETTSNDKPARNTATTSKAHPSPTAHANTNPAPQPKRKRKRRRRKKPATAPSGDSRERDPNARPFGPFALVITPTRELAQQIDDVVSVVCEHTNQRAVIVMGGAKFNRQIRSLESGCDMLVATPGRLIDLMEHDHVSLASVEVLVLDEADRMLDMGFWPSVRRIMAELPANRQNLLFSATIPPSIKSTIDAMLHDPAYVEIARVGQTAETVEEHLCPITQGQKTQLLQELIRTGGAEEGITPERVLVFCRTKQRVDLVSQTLKNAGLSVDVMHADRPQKARERALLKFREGRCQVLVATDVMSRGIDVSGIDAVVNYDVPLDPEDYVHRIGRTGRAGATGHAYTFVAPDEITPLREIEYFTGKLVPAWDLPGFSYDEGRIVPGATRSTVKPKRTMFAGSRGRGRGLYGRHY